MTSNKHELEVKQRSVDSSQDNQRNLLRNLSLEELLKSGYESNMTVLHELGRRIGGRNVTKEQQNKIVNVLHLAATQGVAVAQDKLGYLYANGVGGVWKSHSKAAYWYRLAAEQGVVDAQHELGCCYHFGLGVKKDHREAARWYILAAAQGCEISVRRLQNSDEIARIRKDVEAQMEAEEKAKNLILETLFATNPTAQASVQRILNQLLATSRNEDLSERVDSFVRRIQVIDDSKLLPRDIEKIIGGYMDFDVEKRTLLSQATSLVSGIYNFFTGFRSSTAPTPPLALTGSGNPALPSSTPDTSQQITTTGEEIQESDKMEYS